MLEDKEERIKAEAYRRWEQEGRPEGQHDRHWQEAAQALESGEASDIIESDGTVQALKASKAKAAKPKAAKVIAEAAKPKASNAAAGAAKAETPKAVAEVAKPAIATSKRTKPKKVAAE